MQPLRELKAIVSVKEFSENIADIQLILVFSPPF